MRIARLGVLAAAVAAIAIAPAVAFHDDGVAHCNGCHTMHNSQNNESMNTAADGTSLPIGQGFENLLLWQNKNDLCLRCHAGQNGYHVWADNVLTPGAEHGAGNFVFLEEDNLNDGHAGGAAVGCDLVGFYPTEALCTGAGGTWDSSLANPIPGTSAGHSLASNLMSTVSDGILLTSPGGGYTSTGLTCVSCHDPHGNQGFRLTYVTGQVMSSADNSAVQYQATIEATGISIGFGAGDVETNSNHNAYASGYSDWCATCHGLFHDAAALSYIHPSGENALLGGGQDDIYNAYEGTTDCIDEPPSGLLPCGTGQAADAYLAAVPFERGLGDGSTVNDTSGPSGTSNVACMSCHRAHATSAPDAGRWDFNITGLAEDGLESGSYPIPNPYDEFQRSLCNKCHSKDEFDTAVDFSP